MSRHLKHNDHAAARPSWMKLIVLALVLMGLVLAPGMGTPAEAKKKKEGAAGALSEADAELKKTLDPISTELDKLVAAIDSRMLLSPKQAGQIGEIRYKLMDILATNPTSQLIVKPVYQVATINAYREDYMEAYELFNLLSQNFPATPYGIKAKVQMQQLTKKFGPDYFPTELPVAATAPEPGKDGKAKDAKK